MLRVDQATDLEVVDWKLPVNSGLQVNVRCLSESPSAASSEPCVLRRP